MKQFILLNTIIFRLFLSGSCNTTLNVEENNLSNTPETSLTIHTTPVLIQKTDNIVATIRIQGNSVSPSVLTGLAIKFSGINTSEVLQQVRIFSSTKPKVLNGAVMYGTSAEIEKITQINGQSALDKTDNFFIVSFRAKSNADLTQTITVEDIIFEFDHQFTDTVKWNSKQPVRLGEIVRQQGQDNCDTYRIPGLVTTGKGTLIAVYDARYNSSKDLQEDIDIGMSRSSDGGQTWEPMKIIMDMGEWGGRPQKLNGIGDPCILYDHVTGTLWVAALWMSGTTEKDMLWWASQPGMAPDVTGQFILAKSTDDGLTWSKPVNITNNIKNPGWQLLLQGPGRGICMDDGTLVLPAQFKADTGETAMDGGRYTCHSTIVYSKDHGKTWHIGNGAKANTTEAQVVELPDGSLMLNMRDDRNRKDKGETNGRAVAVTKDMGITWTIHPSSNHALPEPNCMASIIGADIMLNGSKKYVLFYSNPNNKYERTNMTIKASIDSGLTWPEEYQLELNENQGYGYSCLTMVDEQTIGILYEGEKELYFQKISVFELFKPSQ